MKHITKIALLAFVIGAYSCHSTTKKVKVDTSSVVTYRQSTSAINADSPSPEVDRDTLRQPLLSKLIFPNFSIKVNSCGFLGYRDDHDKFVYSGDTTADKIDTKNYKMWTLTTKNDTVHLTTVNDNGLDIDKIEIEPNTKTDKFEVSYSFKVQITAENGKDGILWESMMPYKKVKDSSTLLFKISESFNNGSDIKEVKRKLKLRDTAFKKEAANHDYGIYTEQGVIFKNQLCEIENSSIIYLKIDRFSESKLQETKYLVIDFSIPE